jgi:hypothetical protein
MTASPSRTAKPNQKPERKNPQQLDRPTHRGTYLQPGSNLDENPASDLSENQQLNIIGALLTSVVVFGGVIALSLIVVLPIVLHQAGISGAIR